MATFQQAHAEYELSKYAHTICCIGRAFSTHTSCRYLQLLHGDESLLLAEDAALRGSLNDRMELTIVHLGIVTAPEDQMVC